VNRWLRPWVVVLLAALIYAGVTLVRYGYDPLAFAMVGTRYSQGDPQGSQGYDGQFAYYIARDPAQGWQYCDVPAYRYQRILYPLLAWVLALGQPEWVGWTLIVINIAALAGGTYFTERLLAAEGANRWYALAYGLYGGLVAGLRLDLTEPLAYGLAQAGLWAWSVQESKRVGSKRQEGLVPGRARAPLSNILHHASCTRDPQCPQLTHRRRLLRPSTSCSSLVVQSVIWAASTATISPRKGSIPTLIFA